MSYVLIVIAGSILIFVMAALAWLWVVKSVATMLGSEMGTLKRALLCWGLQLVFAILTIIATIILQFIFGMSFGLAIVSAILSFMGSGYSAKIAFGISFWRGIATLLLANILFAAIAAACLYILMHFFGFKPKSFMSNEKPAAAISLYVYKEKVCACQNYRAFQKLNAELGMDSRENVKALVDASVEENGATHTESLFKEAKHCIDNLQKSNRISHDDLAKETDDADHQTATADLPDKLPITTEYKTIELKQLPQYIGFNITIALKNGETKKGILEKNEFDTLHLRTTSYGGYMTIPITHNNIDKIEVLLNK